MALWKFQKPSICSARHTHFILLWSKTRSTSVAQMNLKHQIEKQAQDYFLYFGNSKMDQTDDKLFKDLLD